MSKCAVRKIHSGSQQRVHKPQTYCRAAFIAPTTWFWSLPGLCLIGLSID